MKKDYELRHVYLFDRTSPWNNSGITERIGVKFYIGEFYYKFVKIIPFWLKSDKTTYFTLRPTNISDALSQFTR